MEIHNPFITDFFFLLFCCHSAELIYTLCCTCTDRKWRKFRIIICYRSTQNTSVFLFGDFRGDMVIFP